MYAGPIVGTVILRILSTLVTKGGEFEPIIFGGALILFSLLAPEGIAGAGVTLFRKLRFLEANELGQGRRG
jgi:ABC-type branched-subunit amino acid transport system permease subunit